MGISDCTCVQSPMFWPSNFNFQVNELIYYFGFYIFGVYLFKNIHLLKTLSQNGWFYLVISLPFIFLLNGSTERYDLTRNVVVDITTWKIANIQLWKDGLFSNSTEWFKLLFFRLQYLLDALPWVYWLSSPYLNKPGRYIRLADSAYWVFCPSLLFSRF